MIPLDGDVLSFYYRKDLFEKYDKQPPKTWEEYTELAKVRACSYLVSYKVFTLLFLIRRL